MSSLPQPSIISKLSSDATDEVFMHQFKPSENKILIFAVREGELSI